MKWKIKVMLETTNQVYVYVYVCIHFRLEYVGIPHRSSLTRNFLGPSCSLVFSCFFPYVSHIFPLSAGNCWGTRHQSKPWFDPTSIPPSSVNSIFSWQTKYGQVTISAGKTTICHHLSIVFPDVFPVQFSPWRYFLPRVFLSLQTAEST